MFVESANVFTVTLNKGEINLIPDNDSAQQNYDTSYSSYNWRSVAASDGSFNIPGYVGSLKYDGNTNATFKLSNTLAAQCPTALTFPVFDFKTLPILSSYSFIIRTADCHATR